MSQFEIERLRGAWLRGGAKQPPAGNSVREDDHWNGDQREHDEDRVPHTGSFAAGSFDSQAI